MIERNVDKSNKTVVYTDELPSYNNVERLGYSHEIVRHLPNSMLVALST